MGCVDVTIPSDDFCSGLRLTDGSEQSGAGIVADHLVRQPPLHHLLAGMLPLKTGPPGLLACPHRAVITTTRLLV